MARSSCSCPRPMLALYSATREHAERMGVGHTILTITHGGITALAKVIIKS